MGFTQAQLDTLENAIASGAKTVKYTDKTVIYNDISDMLRARDIIRASLGQTKSQLTRVKTEHKKGLIDSNSDVEGA